MVKNKATFRKRKSKLGDFLIDIAKYVVTAILFAAVFKDSDQWNTLYFLPVIAVVFITVAAGLMLQEAEPENKKKK